MLERVKAHLGSEEYRRRVAEIEERGETGILIPAGGMRYSYSLVVTLRVGVTLS